jgi:hypothetical protein
MNWRRTPEGFLSIPYSVKWRQGRWAALRQADKHSFPEQLGTFDTSDEAKEACAECRGKRESA